MAQTNNIQDKLTNLELSIQVSLSGLSFCILQIETNSISYLKHIVFEKKQTPFEVLDSLKQAFNSEIELRSIFESVTIVYVNELSTMVPKALFNENNLADYLKFNSKILQSDFITYDDILINDSVNVYVPYVNINNYIFDKYGSFSYKHFSTILVEQLLTAEKNSESVKMFVNVSRNHFEIVVTKQSQLILYNTFEYTTKEDFIYYILFTAEQLQLNPENLNLILLGDIEKDDELYSIAYKYIRHVDFGERNDSYNYISDPNSKYSDFTLIHSL